MGSSLHVVSPLVITIITCYVFCRPNFVSHRSIALPVIFTITLGGLSQRSAINLILCQVRKVRVRPRIDCFLRAVRVYV